MNAPSRTLPAKVYPHQAAITRAINAAKACGLDVAGFRVNPSDGSIEVFEARAQGGDTLFDQMEREGKI